MEAVPRLPMISFRLKVSPVPTSFGPKLKQYIREFYHEDPESYTNEIEQLETLRVMAVRPFIAVTGCSLLKKYYCQLHFVQSRFPMGNDEPAAVSFSWKDAYANMIFTLSNIRFEIISILYNIGAIHTQLGATTERTSADGMKMACSHFQCAAWAFEHLQNSYPQPPGVDMAPELMKFMHQLCLAQAQECILEKSMLDNRKPTIVAKVAKQIVDYYALALWTLEPSNSDENTISETVGSKIYKSWKTYVKFKKAYYMAVTLLYQGLASEEQQKMGERVAFYNAALASLNSARSLHTSAKGSTGITGVAGEKEAIEEALVFTNDVIEGKRKAAKNENEFIYHEEVPDKDALPTVNGASLVKGISFNVNDAEISGPDIFARLVPMKVHEASSLYSEEKAKILRSVGSKIEEKDQALEMYLASLKLQHLNLWDPDRPEEVENLPLPEELAERCAALNAKPTAIQDLEDIMSKLSATYGDVETMLKNIDKLLAEEERKEKQYQEAVGKRPPSIVATDLTREAKKYEEAHAKASESNQALHRAMSLHLNNLQILAQPLDELMASIPSIKSGKNPEGETDKQNVRELKRILGKIEEMQRQRSDLYSKLRDSISQDNLTRLLVTATADSAPLDTLFAEQLEKHQSLVNLIDQNLAAQENILTALTDAYARTAETRKAVEEVLKRRELMISSLIASYDAYEDLVTKSSKGLEFYRKLEVNVTKLLQRVKSTCRVQEEEREQILARNDKDNNVDSSTIPTTEKKSGSGMKLRDHLANRIKNNPIYQTAYGDKQTTSVASVQSNIHPGLKSYPTDPIDMDLQDPQQIYQYYDYKNYCMNNSYMAQQYSGYDATNQRTINHSLPRSNTTNSDNMYHQAGGLTNTEVVSNSNQYAGYSNIRNDQPSLPIVSQHPYPIQTGYEESNYPQYPDYHAIQGYQVPTSYQSVLGQQQNYPLTYQSNLAAGQSSSQTSALNQQGIQPQHISVEPAATNVVSQSQQYNTLATVNHDIYASYQTSVSNPSISVPYQTPMSTLPTSETLKNYPVVNQESIHPISQTNQILQQMYSTSEASNQQYITQQATVHTANSGYTVSNQYSTNQPDEIISNRAMDQSQYYYTSSHNTSVQPTSSYIHSSQQSYMDPAVVQPSIPNPQVSINPSTQTYANNYGQTYSVDTNNHQYQIPQVPSNSQISINYPNDPEIIQSHTKSSGYLQNYQYSLQSHTGMAQYPNYSQGYSGTWDSQQAHGLGNDSYKGHPGYSFNSNLGSYEYSSGYQNSQSSQEPTTPNPSQNIQTQDQSNSCYTSANNASITNLTPSSQHSNKTFEPTVDEKNYYTTPYGVQNYNQETAKSESNNYGQTYVQSSNNETVTTTSESKKSEISPELKSNLDLLADLDITINHAPLVPEIQPTKKESKNDSTFDVVEKPNKKENDDTNISQIDDKLENLQIVWDTWYNDVQPKKDPLGDPVILQKFINDIEKYEKFIDSLTVKTLSGSTSLDIKWKEVQDFEERENKKQTCNVAIAHSSENRSNDWIPYDSTRVRLSGINKTLDYINASHITDLTQWTPTFIVTQAPKPSSFEAFWTMIWEQGSEVIACLCTDSQLNDDIYWPMNKDSNLNIGSFVLSLKSSTNHVTYVQRVIGIIHSERKIERVVVHMQYLAWPATGLPSSPGPLLSFATDIMSEQALRHCPKPIVVHCFIGGPLSGLFLLAAATVCHVRAGHGVVDVPLVFSTYSKYRTCLISKEFLLFGYRMVLYHAQDILMKRGILSSTRSTFDGFDSMKGNKGVGVQHGLTRQSNEQLTGPSQSKVNKESEEKTDRAKPVDPLSQLDPLWSIRR
ncbi:tyrosine-protein phosphatase non-receptor type 23 isoform X2 [Chelonus insularis]|uniref:tyrosine-protein phosphatase non-receptor type 23 isoform X2 n=1 Tax=Chelonus insularis TaxID=460826 RepID=UPI00158CA5EE|nr:tyrosine-protein phosphatase non-receptor type 23 isoform X2 [Chelonus insularis]